MASVWRILEEGQSPSVATFLHLSNANLQRIRSLTSHESYTEVLLNPSQCRSISSKLVRTLENIAGPFYFWDIESSNATSNTSTLPAVVLENFYLVSERAKELVESCCTAESDLCQAATFQIQNEEAFKEILLETSLCYNSIFELVKDNVPYQDLRFTSTFEPPTSAEVMQDRMALLQRLQNFVHTAHTADSLIRKQHLAKHLLRRLRPITSQSSIEDFDACHLSLWADGKSPGDEWGNSDFLGGNVCKTTWLDVPCAKKFFELGVQESEILAEARILARLNHPNIVKFVCCGKDSKRKLRHFIAMEQMEEGLHFVISQQAQDKNAAPFPLRSAVDIMLQIAYGTCYLHDNGIAHRDLKPSNVVVSQITAPYLKDYFQAKVVDFGLSNVKLSASRSNTISRPKIGTTVYMAPEAFNDGRANWFKADVYSFGIMCAVILSGEEPFQGMLRSKVYKAICNGGRPRLPPDTPEELATLIRKCWDTDRNGRPDFVEICTELAKLRHKLLREDAHGHMSSFTDEMEEVASLHIQEMIKKRSDSRKQNSSHVQLGELPTLIETDGRPVQNQMFNDDIEPTLKQNSSSFRNPPAAPLQSLPFRRSPPRIARGNMNPISVPSTSRAHESPRIMPTEVEPSEHSFPFLFNDNVKPLRKNSSSFISGCHARSIRPEWASLSPPEWASVSPLEWASLGSPESDSLSPGNALELASPEFPGISFPVSRECRVISFP